MLLSPKAVRRLKKVTQSYWYNWYPKATHTERNELSRMFLEEVNKLLDQKSESLVKRAVEQYVNGDLSYEQYLQRVEQIAQEEGERGADYGRTYASNQVFSLAQKEVERVKKHREGLEVLEAKQQMERERAETVTHIKATEQAALTALTIGCPRPPAPTRCIALPPQAGHTSPVLRPRKKAPLDSSVPVSRSLE